MGEKGIAAMERLPPGYHIPAPGSTPPGGSGAVKTTAGMAYPDGRPGYSITWDEEHGSWRPPGFTPDAVDNDRVFNPTTGQNGVWDGDKQQWIDTATGQPISYDQ